MFTPEQYKALAEKFGQQPDIDPTALLTEITGTAEAQDKAIKAVAADKLAKQAEIDRLQKLADDATAAVNAAREETKTVQATLAASSTPKPLDAIQQMSMQDSVDALSERAVKRGFHQKVIDGVVSCFREGSGFAVVAASTSAHGKPLLRDVLAVLANGEVGVPTGQLSEVVQAASTAATNPEPPAPPKDGEAARNYVNKTYGARPKATA